MAEQSFRNRVLDVVRSIPKGQVMSYRDVAAAAGNPRAYRAVGNIMAANFDDGVPCHRVVRSDGQPSGYNRGGYAKKRARLLAEGAHVK